MRFIESPELSVVVAGLWVDHVHRRDRLRYHGSWAAVVDGHRGSESPVVLESSSLDRVGH